LNNLKSTKINAIFLAAILVAGTIATILPSVQAQSYYEDNIYEPEYPSEYTDNQYNTYEPREYPSYQPDYKPEYPSDNNYKSEKDSSSVSINKLKCINNNVNINGNNTGNINLGNKGTGQEGGYSDAYSYGGSGGYGGEGYNDGYDNKKDKGIDCIINNNNNNINIIGGGGNVTDGEEPKPTCGECFSRLTQPLQNSFNMFLNDEIQDIVLTPTLTIPGSVIGISQLCTFFNTVDPIPLTQAQITASINMLLQELPSGSTIPGAQAQLQALFLCLIEADIIVVV
jgi:hypothetical protein